MYCSSTNFFHFSTPLNADVIYVSSLVVEGVADLPHLLRVLTHDFAPRGEQAPRAEGRGGRLGLRHGLVFPPAFLRSVRRDTLAFVRLLCISERGALSLSLSVLHCSMNDSVPIMVPGPRVFRYKQLLLLYPSLLAKYMSNSVNMRSILLSPLAEHIVNSE